MKRLDFGILRKLRTHHGEPSCRFDDYDGRRGDGRSDSRDTGRGGSDATDFAEDLLFDAANAEDVQLASASTEERDGREQELADKLSAVVQDRFGGDYDKAFEYFDKDNDATLNRSELSDALGDIGIGNFITRGMWVDGIMEKLDKSPTDGKLSYDELLSAVGQTA